MKNILFTAEELNSKLFKQRLGQALSGKLLHVPLERTEYFITEQEGEMLTKSLDEYTFCIHGGLRNATYFMQWVEKNSLSEKIKHCIHLVADRVTQSFLEAQDIPAILPRDYAKGIDILEFLLRISRQGNVLYPATEQHTEEIPGLLKELQLPVTEFTVCRERSLTGKELHAARKKVDRQKPDTILFHDRASVNRIQLAFPDLPVNELYVISASRGVTEKLCSEGIRVDEEATGSWLSVANILEKKHV